jgi:hypothetical protein
MSLQRYRDIGFQVLSKPDKEVNKEGFEIAVYLATDISLKLYMTCVVFLRRCGFLLLSVLQTIETGDK